MSLQRGGNPPTPARGPSLRQSVAAQARTQTAATLWPHASRASVVLLAGGALVALELVTNSDTRGPLGALGLALVAGGEAPAPPQYGAAGRALSSMFKPAAALVALALFASINEVTGTLAVLLLAALWFGFLWGAKSPLAAVTGGSKTTTSASGSTPPANGK